PEWKSSFHLKGGNFTRALALVIALAIAFFCLLGQGVTSWLCFGVYLLVGFLLWLWMVLFKWKKEPVRIQTPDGEKEF
ncbi:MAG: APC family permease, partial [Clostridia bacterium]|nr:APC family permease [Clostridia bacterium]